MLPNRKGAHERKYRVILKNIWSKTKPSCIKIKIKIKYRVKETLFTT